MGEWTKKKHLEKTRKQYSNIQEYYHYTSLSTAWAILENDSLWASHARFSNDSEELKKGMKIMQSIVEEKYSADPDKKQLISYLGKLSESEIDSYIVCFCGSDDKLSQWRGYCRKDGISFGFSFGDAFKYYLKDNSLQTEILDTLHQVYYIDNNDSSDIVKLKKELHMELKDMTYEADHSAMEDILLSHIPLIKHPGFTEEDEYRFVIINSLETLPGDSDNPLDGLIKYKDDKAGAKCPYIRVCFGKDYDDIGKEIAPPPSIRLYGICDDIIAKIHEKYPDAVVQEINNENPYILVGEAPEDKQKEVLRNLEEIKELYFREHYSLSDNISIWFEGHLPIRTITVSPCLNQEEVVESLSHYCTHEKYWLKYVKVRGSSIPYRRPKE